MPFIKRAILVFVFLLFAGAKTTLATCEVTPSTASVLPNTSTSLDLTFKNTGSNPVLWLKIPSNYSSVVTLSSPILQESGWSMDSSTGDFIYTGGSLDPNSSLHLNVTLQTGDERTMDINWFSSENISGDSADTCSPLSLSITSVIPTPTPAPSISNTSLSIGNTYATLTWTTDQSATGNINYGTSASYGSSATTNSGTSHSVTLQGLSSSTTYHYQIQVTGSGGTTSTSDATFTTSAESVTTVTTTSVTSTTTTSTTVIQKILVDKIAPIISLSTDFSKPFKVAPAIQGKSTDGGAVNVGVVSLDYSLDNGKNWLPVDIIETPGKRTTTFTFTPLGLDDGNYLIKVRAKDATGNTGFSKVSTMVIDRLPPQVGGSLFSQGPMTLKPVLGGNIYSVTGLPIKIVLSAVGGPISMDLFYGTEQTPLQKNLDSGLWTGQIKASKEGKHEIIIKSVDGAGNRTERSLGNILALAPGKVTTANNQPVTSSKISIYTFDKTQNDYVLWEAEPYQETNPQNVDTDGSYKVFLPSGKYFLEVTAPGKRKLRTDIFEVKTPTPLTQNFILEDANLWTMWFAQNIPVKLSDINPENTASTSNLIGKQMPDFDLSHPGLVFNNTSILGKPTIMTFLSSWEPLTADQLKVLDQFKSENEGVNVLAIAVQESVSKIDIFKKAGGYAIPIIADPDGLFVLPLDLKPLPTHIFIDRKGIIKEASIGFLDKNNLLSKILQ